MEAVGAGAFTSQMPLLPLSQLLRSTEVNKLTLLKQEIHLKIKTLIRVAQS